MASALQAAMQTDLLIVGGGLSGLSLAMRLQAAGVDYLLIDARDRLGGRIKCAQHDGNAYDLGPAWFWPGQPRMLDLIQRLDLIAFAQQAQGDALYEDDGGRVQRARGFASMQGSWRIDGGMAALIDRMAATLPVERILTGSAATTLTDGTQGVSVMLADGRNIDARRVALAIPPRLAATSLGFAPALHATTRKAMADVPTWMAGQAKAVAIYDAPFWRDAGLSGDAVSQRGPLAELHDASPADHSAGALFGFIGLPVAARVNQYALEQAIRAQLGRLFGHAAQAPDALHIKDWAADPFCATDADQAPLFAHPRYGKPAALSDLWGGRLLFAGTEVAPEFGGYLEGALAAAEAAALTFCAP